MMVNYGAVHGSDYSISSGVLASKGDVRGCADDDHECETYRRSREPGAIDGRRRRTEDDGSNDISHAVPDEGQSADGRLF